MYNCYPAMSIDSCVLVPTIHTYKLQYPSDPPKE